ncbi:MAG: hypothetical protein IIA50_02330, partial [Bacteroidetes bacterium]|nr:hypothetical protein [Bacteroidota bacterium]
MGETRKRRFENLIGGKRRQTLVSVLFGLGLVALATWAIGRWDTGRIAASARDEQVLVVRNALDSIDEDFRSLQEAMLQEARGLANDPGIVLNLRRVRAGDRSGEEGVVRAMAAYTLPDHGSVEVYDQQPRLVGWSGLSMPLDASPSEPGFLELSQTSLAFDGDRHAALVVWWPVRDGTDIIGAVRVLRMIVKHVPVRNEFLKDYTLDGEWSRMTGLSVHVDLAPGDVRAVDDPEYSRLLLALDGDVLVHVAVTPPTVDQLAGSLRKRYTDVVYFWLVIAMSVMLMALGRWSVGERPDETEARRPLYRFGVFASCLVAARYFLLAIEVPSRWQLGKAPLSPLFDPQHLASDFGLGLMRTSGDLLLTSILAVIMSLVFVRATEPVRLRAKDRKRIGPAGSDFRSS